ncbi:MAG: hypothetical protein ACE5NM_13480 [Sedimentisphaerales bacterium]
MKESRKKLNTTSTMLAGLAKPVMLVIIVVCFTLAVVIFIKTQSGGSGGIETIKRGEELYWVKCNNKKCNAEYQMDKRDYYEQIEEKMKANPMAMVTPPLTCKECGEQSLLRAVKCEKCGQVFFYGADPTDFADRCPECGHSKTEAERKARAAQRGK